MDLRHLTAFVKVVQTGSFTAAAVQLHTRKSHVSKLVSDFESKLGVRLLNRSTRALHLTEIGSNLFKRAVAILAAVEDAERIANTELDEPRGTLKMSCGVVFGLIAVNRWISSYLDLYPHMRVEADYSDRLVDIVQEGFDLAIRVGPLHDSRLAARKLGEMEYGLYASPGYLARRSVPRSPDALREHDILMFSAGGRGSTWKFIRNRKETRLSLQTRLNANNSHVLREAASQGQGIAQLLLAIAEPEVAAGRLRRVLRGWQLPKVPVNAVFPSRSHLTPKVRAFVDLAAESFGSPEENFTRSKARRAPGA